MKTREKGGSKRERKGGMQTERGRWGREGGEGRQVEEVNN